MSSSSGVRRRLLRSPLSPAPETAALASPPSPANDVDDTVTEHLIALVGLPSAVTRLAARVKRLEHELEILRQGDPDQLLDTEQAAQLLGKSEAAVRQAARRGRLPAEYLGRNLRFRRGALLASTDPQVQRQRAAGRPTDQID